MSEGNSLKIKVRQGSVKIEDIYLMRQTEELVWIEAVCEQKYPEAGSRTDRCLFLFLPKSDNKGDLSNHDTEIRVEGLEGHWSMVVEADRYTVRLLFVKVPPQEEIKDLDWKEFEY